MQVVRVSNNTVGRNVIYENRKVRERPGQQ